MVIPTKIKCPHQTRNAFIKANVHLNNTLADFLILKAETGLQDESYLIRRLVNGLNEQL